MAAQTEGSRRTGNKVGSNKGIARMRKEDRRAEAETRAVEREARGDDVQCLLIEKRPGHSRRERERLVKRAAKAAAAS